MPTPGFPKGNKLWKKSLAARKEKQDKIDVFMMKLSEGGIEVYNDIMGRLANGELLSKGELEYMDRFEGWREYIKPKLKKSDDTVKVDAGPTLLEILDGVKQRREDNRQPDKVHREDVGADDSKE